MTGHRIPNSEAARFSCNTAIDVDNCILGRDFGMESAKQFMQWLMQEIHDAEDDRKRGDQLIHLYIHSGLLPLRELLQELEVLPRDNNSITDLVRVVRKMIYWPFYKFVNKNYGFIDDREVLIDFREFILSISEKFLAYF